jgi:enterochelin esterase-like enzyme
VSIITFDGCSYAGERVGIEVSRIVAVVSAQPEEGQMEPRTIIMFRSADTDHRAAVNHTVDEVASAINKVLMF